MRKIIKKAAKYESKKSLDGSMKFLKGNVGSAQKDIPTAKRPLLKKK
jgi:hypothetical protein